MNNLKHSDDGGENIIFVTKTASTKPECENTIPKWAKQCPTCNKELVYSSIHELRRALKTNTICSKCRGLKNSIPMPATGWTKPCPMCGKELTYNDVRGLHESIKSNSTCVACRGLKRRTPIPIGGWKKPCPKCGTELSYLSGQTWNKSIKEKWVCSACAPHRKKLPIPDGGWKRKCPTCSKELHYKKKWAFQQAEKYNTKCSSCGKLSNPIMDKYVRNCPICNKELEYKRKDSYYTALKANSSCKRCKQLGKKMSEETKRKLSVAHKGKPGHPHTAQHRQKITEAGNPMYGVHRYDELNPFYGKRHSEEARRKMRVAMCKKVLRMYWSHGRMASIGAGEKAYFDQLERERGWFGNRQHFVSHLGYFVDYYEPNHNIVVEYDEPRHYRHGHLREKDRVRMEQIREHLNCEFWRYDAYRKQLVEF